jgi:hypothetical protein
VKQGDRVFGHHGACTRIGPVDRRPGIYTDIAAVAEYTAWPGSDDDWFDVELSLDNKLLAGPQGVNNVGCTTSGCHEAASTGGRDSVYGNDERLPAACAASAWRRSPSCAWPAMDAKGMAVRDVKRVGGITRVANPKVSNHDTQT